MRIFSISIAALASALLLHVFIQRVEGGNRSDAENLHDHILTGYRKSIRPYYDRTIKITLGMVLFSINEFDEISGTFSAVAAFFISWFDPRLKWNKEDFGNLSKLAVPSSDIWYPDLYFINPAKGMVAIGDNTFFTTLRQSGRIYRTIGSITSTSCSVDMSYFPFDEQVNM